MPLELFIVVGWLVPTDACEPSANPAGRLEILIVPRDQFHPSGRHMLFGWTRTATMNITGGTMNMTGSGNLWNIGHSTNSYFAPGAKKMPNCPPSGPSQKRSSPPNTWILDSSVPLASSGGTTPLAISL